MAIHTNPEVRPSTATPIPPEEAWAELIGGDWDQRGGCRRNSVRGGNEKGALGVSGLGDRPALKSN